MSYDSMEDFRNLQESSISLKQGDNSNEDKKKFNYLVPSPYMSLIQDDKINSPKEGFENIGEKCSAHCGHKLASCQNINKGKNSCKNAINLQNKKKCEAAFGGNACKWIDNDWRPCTPQCKQWNCDNCKENKYSDDIDQLQQLYMDTLRKYTNEYKSLGDPNLTQEEGKNIARIVKKINEQLLKISNALYKKIKEMDGENKEIDNQNLDKVGEGQMNEVNKFKEKLGKVLKSDKIESGEYADNELRVNYAYYHYLLWIVLSVVLIGGISLLWLNIEVPEIFKIWPLKGIPIVIMLLIGYFIFSRAYWNFKRTLNLYTAVV